MRIAKLEKRVEIKMIQHLEMIQYQSRKSRAKKRFTEYSYATLWVHLSRLRLSPSLYYFVIKGKEKRQIIFLYISVVFLLPWIQHRMQFSFTAFNSFEF